MSQQPPSEKNLVTLMEYPSPVKESSKITLKFLSFLEERVYLFFFFNLHFLIFFLFHITLYSR